MKNTALLAIVVLINYSLHAQGVTIFQTRMGKISFQSDAPFELIKASSNSMFGLLDVKKNIFGFSVRMETFQGFNSALQREHFNENYIDSKKYPEATFKGKIIEDVDFSKDGTYTVRAKGDFTVHGVTQERIIKSEVTVKDGKISIQSSFTVLLSDHNIPIPKVVKDKLATEINVDVNCQLQPRT
jgi:hypothetical protein